MPIVSLSPARPRLPSLLTRTLVALLTSACTGQIALSPASRSERDAETEDAGDDDPELDPAMPGQPDATTSTTFEGGTRDAQSADARADVDTSVADAASSPPDAGSPTPDASIMLSGRSAGCGKSASGNGQFVDRSISAAGRERSYALLVPSGYQASRAYPLIFRFHGTGGDATSGGLGIDGPANGQALIVSPDGLVGGGGARGWSEGNEAADLALFDELLSSLSATYCIDLDRVYAYGFSAGAGLSELLACKRGSKLRGIGAIAGWDRTRGASCEDDVAALLFHDTDDDAVTIEMGRAGREKLRVQSGCSSETEPTDDADCVQYLDCQPGAPLVWCETSGLGHDIRGDVAPGKVWQFFEML